jgi:hypothetical protein
LIGVATASAVTPPAPPFNECPAIGASPSCGVLIDAQNGGASYLTDTTVGPYDQIEDTLIGFINNSSSAISSINLATPGINSFGFDGDGICSGYSFTGSGGCPFDSTGYGGPGVSFTNIDAAADAGTVNFSPAIPPHGTTYFSLEEALSGQSFVPPVTPKITTQASGTLPAGGFASDSATVTSPNNPTGTVTFNLYGPNDTTCSNSIGSATGTLDANGTTSSGPIQVGAAGVYRWRATYNGDPLDYPVTSKCGAEKFTVTPQKMHGRAFNLTVATATLGVSSYLVGPIQDTGMVTTSQSVNVTPACKVLTLGIVNAQALCDSVVTTAYPADVTSTSSLAGAQIGVTGVPAIVLGAVTTTSDTSCAGSTGSTTIAYLSVGGHVVINSPTVIAPNTHVTVAGITLVLNEQLPIPGGLRVNAVHVSVGNGTSSIYITVAHAETSIDNCP